MDPGKKWTAPASCLQMCGAGVKLGAPSHAWQSVKLLKCLMVWSPRRCRRSVLRTYQVAARSEWSRTRRLVTARDCKLQWQFAAGGIRKRRQGPIEYNFGSCRFASRLMLSGLRTGGAAVFAGRAECCLACSSELRMLRKSQEDLRDVFGLTSVVVGTTHAAH